MDFVPKITTHKTKDMRSINNMGANLRSSDALWLFTEYCEEPAPDRLI